MASSRKASSAAPTEPPVSEGDGTAAGPPTLEAGMRQWPADRVERWPIERIRPYARNARIHGDEQVEQIAASMRAFGVTGPILVDEEGVIIYGHGRQLGALKNGYTEMPVCVAIGWSEAEKAAYRLADNQIALNSSWDPDFLRVELLQLKAANFNLDLTGFGEIQLVNFMALPRVTDPDKRPDPLPAVVTRPGEVWVLGRHRILCGDSQSPEDVAKLLAGRRPRLMNTDPPYGVDYDPMWRNNVKRQDGSMGGAKATGEVTNDHQVDWREAFKLSPADVCYVWHSGLYAAETQAALEAAGYEQRAQIIWAKHQKVIGRGDYHWQHEPCFYGVRKGKTGHWNGDRTQSTVWDIAAPSGWAQVTEGADAHSIHSTQKPIECMKRPIDNNTVPGDDVYDPFSGSGTTIIACEMTKRNCLAIDLLPAYVDIAVLRWQEYAKAEATLEGDGRTFAAIAAERLGESHAARDP